MAAAADRAAFVRISRANELAESGGAGVIASRLVTTAGHGNPASIGRSQLLVSLQVEFAKELARAPAGPERLERYGVSVDDLRRLDARGDAVVVWYDAIVRGRRVASCPLSPGDVRAIRTSIARGDSESVAAAFGERFTAATGLPPTELVAMAQTRLLLEPHVDDRFRAIRSRTTSDSAALDALVAERPELEPVRARIGDDRSMAYFLRRPKRNGEHRAAWYTRAARSEGPAFDRFTAALVAGLDRETSRLHASRTFSVARRFVDAMPDAASLDPSRRESLIGRLQRLLHGNPSFFRTQFGTADSPRVHCAREIDARLRSFADSSVTTAAGDQARSLRAFEARYRQVVAGG